MKPIRVLSASSFDADWLGQVKADDKAPLAQKSAVVWNKGDSSAEDKEQTSLFGIEKASFAMPNITKGRAFKKAFEVVVDQSLADKKGFDLGSRIKLSGTDQVLTIVGYTDKATFNVAPVIYMALKDFQQLFSTANPQAKNTVSAILVKGKLSDYPDKDLDALKMSSFIEKIPGYQAQNLTFAFMIGFLIVIAAVVIGIFMFVLTSQKSQIFGLMKIQGLSNFYISKSVLAQTFLLSTLGVLAGLLAVYLSSLVLPPAVPFDYNWGFYAAIAVGMILFALLGAVSSVRTIIKVDPLKSLN